ncbi:MAG: tyrosine-type recombinase/integrase [Terriglobales bacterium]
MRARNQAGWVEETKARTWKAHWYEYVKDSHAGMERRRHHSRVLGDARKMRKFEAKEALSKIVGRLNAIQSSHRDDRVPFSWFVEHRWLPNAEATWGEITRKSNACFVRVIVAAFGEKRLCDLDGVELQKWLNELARKFSRSMVFHCHTCLKSICSAMVDQDYLAKDPARKLKRPKTRKPDETILEWSEYQAVIEAAKTQRDRLAIKVGSGTAVRPGELFAFRWRSLEQLPSGRHALKVTETVYKCKLRQWAKTEGSEDYVPLPKRLAAELLEYRGTVKRASTDDFIFPNRLGGFMDYENFEARVLAPIRSELKLSKLNFQILRRTYASRAVGERIGTLKDVQKQLRHAQPDITLNNYVKEIPESVYAMTDSMYEQMLGADPAPGLAQMPAKGGTQ